MSITTYSELKTALGTWSKRSNLSSLFADFITLGEKRIGRDLRIRAMETAFESTISSGVISLPTGYVELEFAYIDGTPVRTLERKSAEWILYNYPTRAADSKPKAIARQGDNFIFGPYPDMAYTVKGLYFKRFDALSDQNPAGWLVVNAPDLILFASLMELCLYTEDTTAAQTWEGRYQDTLARIQREDSMEEFSGSPLSVSVR